MMYTSKSTIQGYKASFKLPARACGVCHILAAGFQPAVLLAFVTSALLCLSCEDEKSNDDDNDVECHANVDCTGAGACVDGTCIVNASGCQNLGTFVDITEASPQNAEKVNELHVTIDQTGAVHYCYSGTTDNKQVSYYGQQTAWDTFVEEPLKIGELSSIRCAGLTVTSEGTPYILSREPSIVLYLDDTSIWQSITLEGLTSLEASEALESNSTQTSLTPDNQGGIYIGLSLGSWLGFQPIYLAHVNQNSLDELLNGWSSDGEHTATGFAPQFLVQGEDAFTVMGQVLSFRIVLSDADLELVAEKEGAFPKAAVSPNGTALVVYLDRNNYLHLDQVETNAFNEIAEIGKISLSISDQGQAPWEMVVDKKDATHLLIEDATQGQGALVYRTVDKEGQVSAPVVLTDRLITGLPGTQRYGLSTDICNRSTVVIAIEPKQTEETTDLILPVIKIVEGR